MAKTMAVTIVNKLRAAGIPIAKLTKRERRSGVSVYQFNNVACVFEWCDYERTVDWTVGSVLVMEALVKLGYRVSSKVDKKVDCGSYFIFNPQQF